MSNASILDQTYSLHNIQSIVEQIQRVWKKQLLKFSISTMQIEYQINVFPLLNIDDLKHWRPYLFKKIQTICCNNSDLG